MLKYLAEDRGDLETDLKQGMAARVEQAVQPAKDAFLVYAGQALKGINMVLKASRKGDDDESAKGFEFCKLALADLRALQAQAGGGGGAGQGIGKSFGLNGSMSFSSSSSSFNLSVNASEPMTRNIDWGAGVGIGLTSSDNSAAAASSSSQPSSLISTSLNGTLFLRYNFLDAFPDSPWIVPYLGVQGGLGVSANAINTDSPTGTDTLTASLLGGWLFFFNRGTALTLQAEYDSNMSDQVTSTTDTTTSSGQFSISTGMRFFY